MFNQHVMLTDIDKLSKRKKKLKYLLAFFIEFFYHNLTLILTVGCLEQSTSLLNKEEFHLVKAIKKTVHSIY